MKPDVISQIKLLFARSVAFLILFFLVNAILGEILHVIYFSIENKYTKGIIDIQADIVIIGSSRANHHYIPSIIRDSTGLSCFNLGSGGEDLNYDCTVIQLLLEKYSPELIVLEISDREFEKTNETVNKLRELLPFYRNSQAMKNILRRESPMERVKLISGLYPYNSQLANVFYSCIKRNKNPHLVQDGYIPLEGEINSRISRQERKNDHEADTGKLELIANIASLVKCKNTELLLVISPTYVDFSEESRILKIISSEIGRYGFEVWDYEQSPFFLSDSTMFKDELHLNHKGAIEFSGIIAGRIKSEYFRLN